MQRKQKAIHEAVNSIHLYLTTYPHSSAKILNGLGYPPRDVRKYYVHLTSQTECKMLYLPIITGR